MPESVRPIRLKAGPLTFCLEAGEAIGLATKLADAVEELNNQTERKTS